MALVLLLSAFCLSADLISQGKESWASTEQFPASEGNDGNGETRWGSSYDGVDNPDDQWWAVDFGSEYYVTSVEIDWEAAHAATYSLELSNDRAFGTFDTIADITNCQGGNEVIATSTSAKGRYLRFHGTLRSMAYGFSFWELRAYGVTEVKQVNVKIVFPYVQYAKVRFAPAPLDGEAELVVQNKEYSGTMQFNEGTVLTITLLDFRGDTDVNMWAYKQGSNTEKYEGVPFSAPVYADMVIQVELVERPDTGPKAPVVDVGPDQTIYAPTSSVELSGENSRDTDGTIVSFLWTQISGASAKIETPDQAKTTVSGLALGDYKFRLTATDNDGLTGYDEIVVKVLTPETVDFELTSPGNNAMVTDTRKPALKWNAASGATRYDIYLNINREDYEWYASGNLLDRYTKIGESATNSYTVEIELVDRWTYKWYVVAQTGSGEKYSNKAQFGLYIPVIEDHDDGIPIVNGCRDLNKNGQIEPYEDWHLTPDERIDDLMSRMTTEEKVRQLYYDGIDDPTEGFFFSSGLQNELERSQAGAAKTRLGIPMCTLGDNVHGFQTAYPSGIGLSATRDMNMIYQCGKMQRDEHRYAGHTGTLGPIAEVDTKCLYPRFQEGTGENADVGAAMIRALVCGMQAGPELNPASMLITVKHWPSQGAGGEGPTQYDAVSIKWHMKPWIAAVEANAASVMPGYGSSPYMDPSGAGACSSKPTIDYLRNEIGFKGFIVTDWLPAATDVCITSLGAGIDVMGGQGMDHYDYGTYVEPYTNLDELVNAIGMDRVNEACRRVLNAKFRLGLFEDPYPQSKYAFNIDDHRAFVTTVARKMITLIKNDGGALPLKLGAGEDLIVAGPDDLKSSRDPHFIWHTSYALVPDDMNTLLKGITARGTKAGVNVVADDSGSAKYAVVIIGEKSYTHGTEWDDKNPNIPEAQLAILRGFKERGLKVITVVISPRPYVLGSAVELSDAVVLIYRGGNGIFTALPELLFGDFEPHGKLPYQIPKSQDQIGTDTTENQIERWDLPYDFGATSTEREQIRGYIDREEAVPPIFGDPLFQYGYGFDGWDGPA